MNERDSRENMPVDEKQPHPPVGQVIAFLSGKGGSGKTSAAISMAKLLADVGFRVALVDFDLATNGASYFFSEVTSRTTLLGLHEALLGEEPGQLQVNVSENLSFFPSRVNFGRRLPPLDTTPDIYERLRGGLLNLIEGLRREFTFILIDNQAGTTATGRIAAAVADKVVIVSEPDSISSDAVDNLLIQMGESFPKFRRYLINKLDARDAERYKLMVSVFQSLNRLPPLPFDFDVRAAFGSRRIPIDLGNPSAFLIALFTTLKALVPEVIETLEKYEDEKVNRVFARYQEKLQQVTDEREETRAKLQALEELEMHRERRLTLVQGLAVPLGMVFLVVTFVVGWRYLTSSRALGDSTVMLLVTLFVAVAVTAIGSTALPSVIRDLRHFLYLAPRSSPKRYSEILEERSKLATQMSDLNEEVQRYRSFLMTKSKEWLISFGSNIDDSR